ncbi:MAG: glycosyltransferase [Paludibacteraceae bacterium]|nr:glycosyltransferase [Paludibacteraceae bacterium]
MKFSVLVPVYNRPNELRELLESLSSQTFADFEVVVVDDGSTLRCEDVCASFSDKMALRYFYKENSGPGQTRNYAAERAQGEYFLILDSDVILPQDYLKNTADELEREYADAFGGPDRAHDSFTDLQKAISYSMTSFFTTGGIRGGKKKMDKFYPRSFNLGVKADVFRALGGFSSMRFGEDIDFSIRVFKGGYKCRLFPESWVWHKRRTDLKKFFKQVYNSGMARINLYKKYPESLKLVHLLPAVFTAGSLLCIVCAVVCCLLSVVASSSLWACMAGVCIAPIVLYSLLVMVDSMVKNSSVKIGLLSVPAAFTQLWGYGLGFFHAWWLRCVWGRGETSAFSKTFYK